MDTPDDDNDGAESDHYSLNSDALRVYRGSGEPHEECVEVPQGSPEHLEMHTCVNAAMRILGRTRTRAAMATYSTGMVKFRRKNYKKTTAGDMDIYGDEIHHAISKWLDHLCIIFPNLYISPSDIGRCYAETVRSIWGTDISQYNPRLAARISINSEVG